MAHQIPEIDATAKAFLAAVDTTATDTCVNCAIEAAKAMQASLDILIRQIQEAREAKENKRGMN